MKVQKIIRKPVFRNPDKYQILPWREWLRKVFPAGQEGFVVQDLDLIVYRFGSLIYEKSDLYGKFILIEVKYKKYHLEFSQEVLFGLIDSLLRKADPEGNHYAGFYILTWDEDPDEIAINGIIKGMENVKRFLLGEITIPSYQFRKLFKTKL